VTDEPDGAVFVMPRGAGGWGGGTGLWVTVAGWAEAARRRFGQAWVATPDAVMSPAATLAAVQPLADEAPVTSDTRRFAWVPELGRTAVKDIQRARAARAFRDVGEPDDWRDAALAFVWQHHDLFADPGRLLARRHGVPLVSYVHAPQVWEARRWGVERPGWGGVVERVGERRQLAKSDVVACVSDEVAGELGRFGVPDERILVSPMAVDAERFAPDDTGRLATRRALGLDNAFVVGWLGTFRGFHGLDVVVDAFARLRGHTPEARLLLGGAGARAAAVRERAVTRGIDAAVVLAGEVAHTNAPAFLAAMDVAVVSAPPDAPFHYSPQKLREYLAVGLPVAAPRAGEIPGFLRDGEDALLYDAGDVGALAGVLERLHDDGSLASRLGERGRALVEATSTWDIRLDQLLHFPGFVAARERARHALT
jgi:glycosyltransferase involved in cell wall biosynthesis